MKRTIAILISASLVIAGCSSAKKAISDSSQSIRESARESQRSAIEIMDLANSALNTDSDIGDPASLDVRDRIVILSESIVDDQQSILSSTASIQTELHRVEDATPWWARLTSNLAIAGIVLGAIVLLWQTGLGMLIKRVVWGLGMFIPKATMKSAEADLKLLDRNNEMAQREAVAIRRTSDPAYEAARKKLKRRQIQ